MGAKIILFRKPTLSPPIGDDEEMLVEAETIGCIYDNSTTSVRGDNKHYLQQAITDIKTGSLRGSGIRISGPAVTVGGTSQRVAGVLHIDCNPASTQGLLSSNPSSRGPLLFPKDGSGNVVPFVLKGLPGSVLLGGGITESAGVPGHVIEMSNTIGQASNDPDNRAVYIIEDLCVRSASRGIWIKKAGHGTILNRVHVYVTGQLDDTPFGPGTTWTEWHDWSSFQSRLDSDNVPYAIRIDDADGIKLRDCSIKDCLTHGLIATRIHAGEIDLISSENRGVGMAVDRLRNTRLRLRAESNGSYALLGRTIMNSKVTGWVENNRRWNNNQLYSLPGNQHRTVRLEPGCQSNEFYFHATNRHSLWRMSEGTRIANRFRDVDWNDPSRAPSVDETDVTSGILDTSTSTSNKNYATVWTNASFRPTMALDGNDIVLTIPAGAFNTTNIAAPSTTSFLYPFAAASKPSVAVGDHVAWSCEVEFNSDAVTFCNSAEANRTSTLSLSAPLFFKMIHSNDPGTYKEIEQGHANVHIWNSGSSFSMTRKFAGRKEIFSGGSTAFPNLSIGTWTPGLDNSGPAAELTITIRNLRMWHLPKDE